LLPDDAHLRRPRHSTEIQLAYHQRRRLTLSLLSLRRCFFSGAVEHRTSRSLPTTTTTNRQMTVQYPNFEYTCANPAAFVRVTARFFFLPVLHHYRSVNTVANGRHARHFDGVHRHSKNIFFSSVHV
jgi:hypothetical protein